MLKANLALPLAAVTLFGSTLWAQETETTEKVFTPYLAEVSDNDPEREIAVNVRGGDGINYKILSVYKEGRRLVVRGAQGDWLQVEPVDGRLPVWVKSSLLQLDKEKGTVLVDRVVMRAGATVKSASLGVLAKDETLTVLRTVGNWTQVEAPTGTLAWISGKYVRKVDGDLTAMTVTKQPGETTPSEGATVETSGGSQETAPSQPEAGTEPTKENEEIARELNELRSEFEKRLQELQRERADQLEGEDDLAGKSDYTATGQMKLTRDKDGYRLELGGRTTYRLRAALDEERRPVLDLETFNDRKVGVTGKIVELKDGTRVIEVTKITILDSPK